MSARNRALPAHTAARYVLTGRCTAALGLGNKAFASDFGLPAWIAVGSGVAELAGAAMLHKGGEFLAHGALVIAVVMGGAIHAMLRSPTPFAAVFPATFTYGLWYVLTAAKQAQPPVFAAALAAGFVGGLIFTGGKPKKAAAGKKSTAKKAK